MSIMNFTRRGFLKAACIATGGTLIGLRLTSKAVAATKQLKDYMMDRINGTYGADAKFKVRASQDNAQVQAMYKEYLDGHPMSHKAEKLLHTTWQDRSKALAQLKAEGAYPNPRAKEFDKSTYPYE
ncbi:twin-arginine translocation signal domain-containing protein [Desulfovibrio sulfodismutans]|uniref:Twin-arginine translocation signal domain-containing protein n=1 Tax=Desulfolutivibrio sulfodismutans TaxID=63561 RepID=A0A7K3NMM3_9BACT|nr:iron hydrogenase small subunit [Desulfolutivibrio sulfodismutans]NDY57452.1 twin-arginine translocation signal domain-containing protein [Desulfolutivibrio sulfodismutans]QLA11747.1 twin-arginine translocation signal domain-containing protein [Desulfolutivibrio sulfodismutans DSM 3696]